MAVEIHLCNDTYCSLPIWIYFSAVRVEVFMDGGAETWQGYGPRSPIFQEMTRFKPELTELSSDESAGEFVTCDELLAT